MGPISRRIQSVIDSVKQQIEDAETEARKEYGVWLDLELTRIYNAVIADWYDDYVPQYYNRNYSLFDLPELVVHADASVDMKYKSEKITPTRGGNRDYIFMLTFIGGSHGGAPKNSMYGPGNLHYRRPVKYWSHWGSAAKWSPAPYTEIQDRVDEELSQEVVDRKFAEIRQRYISKVKME